GRVLRAAGRVRPDQRGADADERVEADDRADRLARGGAQQGRPPRRAEGGPPTRNATSWAWRSPPPPAMRWSSSAPPSGASGTRSRLAVTSARSGGSGPHRSGPRWATTSPSSRVAIIDSTEH